jgi:hypothetical protein
VSFDAFLADWRRGRLAPMAGGLTDATLHARAAELTELALRHGYADHLAVAASSYEGTNGLVRALYELERNSRLRVEGASPLKRERNHRRRG